MPRTVPRALLASALTGLIIVGIAWSLADATWFMATGGHQTPEQRPPSSTARTAAVDKATLPGVDLQRVASLHIFGVAPVTVVANADATDAPVTALPLQLLGVFVAGIADDSTAVIAEENRDGELFGVGDPLPGNAVLAQVHSDRVVLKRGSEVETLRFPETAGTNGFASSDDPSASFGADAQFDPSDAAMIEAPEPEAVVPDVIDAADPQTRRDSNGQAAGGQTSLAAYRDRLKSEPASVLNEIGMQPINNGAAQGYRVGDNVGSGLARVGLQPGDVVLTVNGQPVGNIQNDQRQVDGVMSQGSARLEVQRGNRRFFVTASLR